jgi:hypothetical protein
VSTFVYLLLAASITNKQILIQWCLFCLFFWIYSCVDCSKSYLYVNDTQRDVESKRNIQALFLRIWKLLHLDEAWNSYCDLFTDVENIFCMITLTDVSLYTTTCDSYTLRPTALAAAQAAPKPTRYNPTLKWFSIKPWAPPPPTPLCFIFAPGRTNEFRLEGLSGNAILRIMWIRYHVEQGSCGARRSKSHYEYIPRNEFLSSVR